MPCYPWKSSEQRQKDKQEAVEHPGGQNVFGPNRSFEVIAADFGQACRSDVAGQLSEAKAPKIGKLRFPVRDSGEPAGYDSEIVLQEHRVRSARQQRRRLQGRPFLTRFSVLARRLLVPRLAGCSAHAGLHAQPPSSGVANPSSVARASSRLVSTADLTFHFRNFKVILHP